MKIIRENIVPFIFALIFTAGFFSILFYIFYDINTSRPPVAMPGSLPAGRIESTDFTPRDNTPVLSEYYQQPGAVSTQPELPRKFFTGDDRRLYDWLDLSEPTTDTRNSK